ncbi:hypothetical protein EGH21_15390 [Halomicroarcula sp. F13]|uniref:CARDB domain-containing protein n=1 Tax=Haloarcula rubra TaxID=2487747 RepID=A0AAW4PVZ6_9EURY|nr:CARDB domain-containing protein [Halomicroarcula rubra]MBX0324412.1 hypothetical protein [Halomicroarcula rubra]
MRRLLTIALTLLLVSAPVALATASTTSTTVSAGMCGDDDECHDDDNGGDGYSNGESDDDGDSDDGDDTDDGSEETTEPSGFRLVDVDRDLQVGEDGTVSVKLENEDLGDLTDATVVLQSSNPEIRVGTGLNGSRFVGDWDEGEQKRVEFAVSATEAARSQRYPLTVRVRYTDPEGNTTQSAPLSFGITPDRAQRFSIDDVDGSLRAGDDGDIEVTVENDGPRDVDDAVLVVRETAEGVTALKSEVALGEFDDDEDETVELPFRVARSAKPTKRQFEFAVLYTTEEGNRRESGPLFADVKIRDRQDVVAVEDVDSDAQVGSLGTVEVTLENEGDDELTDARVTFSSLDAGFRFGTARNTSRFVAEWDAGEEQTFELKARFSNDTVTDEYPVSVTTRYTDEDGDEQIADDVQFGVEPDDEQSFEVDDVEGDLRVGDDGTLRGTVENDGPRDVEDAVLVVQAPEEGVTPLKTQVPLGDFEDGESEDFEFPYRVAESVEPTDRQFEFAVRYTNAEGERRTSDPLFATASIREEVDVVEVVDVDSDAQIDDSGTVTVTLVNDGEEDLTDARVTFSSPDRGLRFGTAANTTRFVGEWSAGEEQTFELPTRVNTDAATDEYPILVTTRYSDEDGDEQVADDVQFGVTPAAEQQFDVESRSSPLRVGRDGSLEGVVLNDGPQDADSAVLRVIPPNDDIVALESEYVLGNFDSGDRASFQFPVRVLDSARPGRKQFEFVVEYRNQDGDVVESKRLPARYAVVAERGQFRIVDVDSDVQVGEDGTVALTLRNVGGEDLTDAVVRLESVSGDLTVGAAGRRNGSRAVGTWDAGDRETVRFQVVTPANAAPQDYPFDVRVVYEDEDGDQQRSDSIPIALTPDPEQAFSVSDVRGNLEVGAERDLTGQVVNDGPTAVEDVVVEITSTTESLMPQETEYALGNLSAEESAQFRLPVRIPADAEAIPRQVQFVVRYTDVDGDRRESKRLSSRLPVDRERDTFRVVRVRQSVRAGDDGNVTLTLENAGNRRVQQVLVSLRSRSGELVVGDAANASRFVDELRPDERRTISFRVSAPENTGGQRFPLRLSVDYEDRTGHSQPAETTLLGVRTAREQAFAVRNVTGTLRVGDEGTVRARIRNRGPGAVTGAFVRLDVGSENLKVQESEAPIGRFGAGETATVTFPVEVLDGTEPGERRVSFVVEYQNTEDETRESDSLPGFIPVDTRRPAFLVRAGNATLDVGGSDIVTLVVTNNLDITLTEVDAKVFVNDPLSTDDDQAFVGRLEPNETVELEFAMSAAGGATTKDYPLSIDFQYQEPDEETKLSDTYRVPVTVQEPAGDGIPWLLLLGLLVILVVIAAAVLFYRRRQSRADVEGTESGESEQSDQSVDDDIETTGG